MSQEAFVAGMARVKCRGRGTPTQPATAQAVRSKKSVAGAGSWLAKESRPDLSMQVSAAQQTTPQPSLGEARSLNTLVWRAKQFHVLTWKAYRY